MMHTAFQQLQVWFGWCPNNPGIHAQNRDQITKHSAQKMIDPESPQPDTPGATITVNNWMAIGALAILFATCFIGGNILWPFFVGAVLIAGIVYWHYRHGREVR